MAHDAIFKTGEAAHFYSLCHTEYYKLCMEQYSTMDAVLNMDHPLQKIKNLIQYFQ